MIRRPLLFIAAAVLAIAGCGSDSKPRAAATSAAPTTASSSAAAPSPSPAGEPKTYDAAKAAVDRVDAAVVAHDGGTMWDLLTASGQATISRDDYAKIVKECPKPFAQTTTVSVALDAGGSTATVSATSPVSGQYTWQMVYENGRWKHQPSSGAMDWMKLGAEKALTVIRNEGSC